MSGEVKEDHAVFAFGFGFQCLVNGGSDGMRGFRRGQDALTVGKLARGFKSTQLMNRERLDQPGRQPSGYQSVDVQVSDDKILNMAHIRVRLTHDPAQHGNPRAVDRKRVAADERMPGGQGPAGHYQTVRAGFRQPFKFFHL